MLLLLIIPCNKENYRWLECVSYLFLRVNTYALSFYT